MKRNACFLILCCAWLPCQLMAQGNSAAEAALERKANEERFTRLTAQVANLEEARELLLTSNAELKQRLDSLAREMDKMKEDNIRSRANFVTRDELNTHLEKLVKEIDKKREADNEAILKNIKELARIPLPAHVEPKPPSDPEAFSNTIEYKVKDKGETLGDIIKAALAKFKEEGRSSINYFTYLEQVKKANPNLNPNLIRVGQTILLPVPPKTKK